MYTPDPASIAGKTLDVAEATQVLVVGGGPAGTAAAIEAAQLGLKVVLVDEHPIPAEAMGEDVPLLFGGRAGGAVRNTNAMVEAMVESDPAIAAAFEAGVDVRLATMAWGLYGNGASVGWLPGPVAALSDGQRSWMIGFERVVVAAGRRDMGLAFPGWDLPGVMGMTAAHALAARYGALDARRSVVLGTTAEALATALALHEAGVTVAAVLDQAATPVGPDHLVAALAAAAIPVLCGRVVRQALAGPDGVECVVSVAVGAAGRHVPGSEETVACDTVVLGIGAVPAIELLDSAGCTVGFRAELGGYGPQLTAQQQSSLPHVFAAGDCAGTWPAKSLDPEIARREGRQAARAAAASLGAAVPATDAAPVPGASYDLEAYRLGWVRASVVEAAGEPFLCRCEEVTAREILEVRPPRYLGWDRPGRNDRSLRTMLGDGAPHPDQVKRLTRAGMGLCQGRRCREQVQALLALEAGCGLASVPLASYRAPVRPLPLRLAAQCAEEPAMTTHWDTWFGMASQYAPPWKVGERYTVAGRDLDDKAASE